MEIKDERTHEPINRDICFIFYECCRMPTCALYELVCVLKDVSFCFYMYRGPAASPKPRFSPRCFPSHMCKSPRPPLAPSPDGECCHCGSQIYAHAKRRTNHSFVVWGISHTLTLQSSPLKPLCYAAAVQIWPAFLSIHRLMERL